MYLKEGLKVKNMVFCQTSETPPPPFTKVWTPYCNILIPFFKIDNNHSFCFGTNIPPIKPIKWQLHWSIRVLDIFEQITEQLVKNCPMREHQNGKKDIVCDWPQEILGITSLIGFANSGSNTQYLLRLAANNVILSKLAPPRWTIFVVMLCDWSKYFQYSHW